MESSSNWTRNPDFQSGQCGFESRTLYSPRKGNHYRRRFEATFLVFFRVGVNRLSHCLWKLSKIPICNTYTIHIGPFRFRQGLSQQTEGLGGEFESLMVHKNEVLLIFDLLAVPNGIRLSFFCVKKQVGSIPA
jgi:hypothetical protein